MSNSASRNQRFEVKIYCTGTQFSSEIVEILPGQRNIGLFEYRRILAKCERYFRDPHVQRSLTYILSLIDEIGLYQASTIPFREFFQEIANETENNICVFIGDNHLLREKDKCQEFFCRGINIFISCASAGLAREYNQQFRSEGKKFIGFKDFVHIVGNLILNNEHEITTNNIHRFNPNIENKNYDGDFLLKFLSIYLKNAIANNHKKITKKLIIDKINKIKTKNALGEKNSRITSNEINIRSTAIREINNCGTNHYKNMYQAKKNMNESQIRIESEKKKKRINARNYNNKRKLALIKNILLGESHDEENDINLSRENLMTKFRNLNFSNKAAEDLMNIFYKTFGISFGSPYEYNNLNSNKTYFCNTNNDKIILTYLNKLNGFNLNNLNIGNVNKDRNIYIKVHKISKCKETNANEQPAEETPENFGGENDYDEYEEPENPYNFKNIDFNTRNNAYFRIYYDSAGNISSEQLKRR